MALRRGAILATAWVSCASAVACPEAGPMLQMVVEVSPQCFESCPQLCEPLDSMVSAYMMSGEKSVLEDMICEARDQFDCVFEPNNLPGCEQVLAMGSTIGMQLPMSQSEWDHLGMGCPSVLLTEGADLPTGATPSAVGGLLLPEPSAPQAREAQPEAIPSPRTTAANVTQVPAVPTSASTTEEAALTTAEPIANATSVAVASLAHIEPEPQSSASATTEAPVPSVDISTSPSSARTTPVPTSAEESTSNPQAASSTAAKAVCTRDNAMVRMVMDISPECFERCPYLCGALEALVLRFAGSPDAAAIERQVCSAKEDFGCAFHPGNLAVCQAVLSAGATFKVPQTGAELSRRCSVAAGGPARDLDLGDGDDDLKLSAAWPRAGVEGAVLLLAWVAYVL